MKDAEFLELLNLYLDHEISAADAARLETEVQAHADRRRVYREYCQMQKACTLLAKDFASEPVAGKIIDFAPRRASWTTGVFAVGGVAMAAACVAFVVVSRTRETGTGAAGSVATLAAATFKDVSVENTPSAVSSLPASQIARAVTIPARRTDTRQTLAPASLAMTQGEGVSSNSRLVAATQDSQAQLEWIKSVQLAPIQQFPMSDLRLDARSALQPASRTYSTARPMEGSVQMSAFRFQH